MYLVHPRRDELAVEPLSKPNPVKVPTNSPLKDPRTGLFYLAVVSIALLVLPPLAAVLVRLWHSLQASLAARRAAQQTDETSPLLAGDDAAENDADDDNVVLMPPPRAESRVLPAGSGSLTGDLRLHVASVGGWVPFGLDLVRLLASLALVGLTLWAIVIDAEDSAAPVGKAPAAGGELVGALGKGHKHGGGRKGRKGERRREAFGREEWVEIGQCFFFIYCATLSLVTLVLPRFRLAKTHLSLLLLAAFLLSAYRNLLPLALGRAPLDIVLHHLKGIHDPLWDTLVWLRVGLLALAGVAVPLTLLLRSPANRETLRHDPLAFFRRREEPAADDAPLE